LLGTRTSRFKSIAASLGGDREIFVVEYRLKISDCNFCLHKKEEGTLDVFPLIQISEFSQNSLRNKWEKSQEKLI
jgi:hypothetical protein